jgi:hypothetical protein
LIRGCVLLFMGCSAGVGGAEGRGSPPGAAVSMVSKFIHPQQSVPGGMDVMPRILGRRQEGRVGDDHGELFAAQ